MECPPDKKAGEKGTLRNPKEHALIERLTSERPAATLFVYEFKVPFDNNQAERDIRNGKAKLKISGGFRSHKGVCDHYGVMSYLLTGRKHGINAIDSLNAADEGHLKIVLEKRP